MSTMIEVSGRLVSVMVPLTIFVGWIHVMFVEKVKHLVLVSRFWTKQNTNSAKMLQWRERKEMMQTMETLVGMTRRYPR